MLAVSRSSSLMAPASRRVFHSTGKSLKSAAIKQPIDQSTNATTKGASFIEKHPFAFQLGVATSKTAAADLMTQTVAEGKSLDEVDWKRNGIFVVFGFCYLGGFQWWLMVHKYRQWFPTMDRFAKMPFSQKIHDKAGILDAAKMVLFDLTIHLPILYFPTYYTVKEFVGGHSWSPVDWVKDGLTKYKTNVKEDLTAMIQLWGPSDCIQFVLPLHLRMPFRHFVSFFWTAYVSFTRGAIDNDNESDSKPSTAIAAVSPVATRATE